jgi:hypothetical protein
VQVKVIEELPTPSPGRRLRGVVERELRGGRRREVRPPLGVLHLSSTGEGKGCNRHQRRQRAQATAALLDEPMPVAEPRFTHDNSQSSSASRYARLARFLKSLRRQFTIKTKVY